MKTSLIQNPNQIHPISNQSANRKTPNPNKPSYRYQQPSPKNQKPPSNHQKPPGKKKFLPQNHKKKGSQHTTISHL